MNTLRGSDEKTLASITAAAEAGERPLTNDCLPGGSYAVSRLTKMGYIKVELWAMNWRTIEIVATGKRTMECPHSGAVRPYKIIEASGITLQDTGKKTPSEEERKAAADLPFLRVNKNEG